MGRNKQVKLSSIEGILEVGKVSRQQKLETLDYFLGGRCVCGVSKKRRTWICQTCYDKQSSKLLVDNKTKCDAHIKTVARILKTSLTKRNNND